MKNNKIRIVIIALSFFVILGIIEIVLFSHPKKTVKGDKENHYSISADKVEDTSKQTYTNDHLKEVHCIDSICIKDVTFYYDEEEGKIEYSIENQSTATASGFLKLVFGNQSIMISYHNLKPNQTEKGSSYFVKTEISNKENYVLEKVTEEEQKSIVYINK